jgi:2-oxoisovalerate dehydrogenase E1 component
MQSQISADQAAKKEAETMLTRIVIRFGEDLEKFKRIAEERYLSWADHPEYIAALDRAFLALREYADHFDPEVARKMLGVVLETRMLYQELLDVYKRGGFKGAMLRGVGQEAVGAGVGCATRSDDSIARDHRNASATIARGTPVYDFWTNHLMRTTSPTGGYDPNIHFMDARHNDLGFLASDMAMSAVLINGSVWYLNAKKELVKGGEIEPQERSCGVAFFGDGAASNGVAHAGMNFAKAWNLPVLFVIHNNQISLRTSPKEQHGGIELSNRALGYEMPMLTVDGDNVFEVHLASKFLLEFCRMTNHPALLHALTFRRAGHNDTERTDYVRHMYTKEFLKQWMGTDEDYFRQWQGTEADPLTKARKACEELGFIDEAGFNALRDEKQSIVLEAYEKASKDPEPSVDDFRDSLLDPTCEVVNQLAGEHPAEKAGAKKQMNHREALQEAMLGEFRNDPLLIMLGEDIGWPGGGVFEVTTPLVSKYEELRKRIRNSTLDEGAISGFVVGVGLLGGRAIAEYQFWNFFLSCPSPVLTVAATRPFMQKIAVAGVLRGPAGYAPQSNDYHESWPETYLLKSLGVKVVVPSTAEDFKGLFKSAVRDPDLVAFIEEMSSYGWKGEVPEGEYFTPFKPAIRREGKDATIITWGPKMLKLALDSAEALVKEKIDMEVIDLRVLRPLDTEFLLRSIRKTGRVVILYEDSKFMGFGAEISAQIGESPSFYELRARIIRVAALDTRIPATLTLEDFRLPNQEKVMRAVKALMEES